MPVQHPCIQLTDCAGFDITAVHFRHGALDFGRGILYRLDSFNFGKLRWVSAWGILFRQS